MGGEEAPLHILAVQVKCTPPKAKSQIPLQKMPPPFATAPLLSRDLAQVAGFIHGKRGLAKVFCECFTPLRHG